MRRYPENVGNTLFEMIHDKRIKPIFWIITVFYFIVVAYIIFFNGDISGSARGIRMVFIIPYFIFAIIYLAFVFGEKKK